MKNKRPSQTELREWLATGEPARITRHLEHCETCTQVLETATDLDERIVADLTEAFAAPEDVESRTARQVERRLRNEEAFLSFLDLFNIGWSTAKTVLDIEEDSQ